jgi:hypothetical protein
MLLITIWILILRMAEFALVDYFIMGEAVGIVATFIVAFYYIEDKCNLSVDIETKVLSHLHNHLQRFYN